METQIKKLASMGILSSISSVIQDEQRSVKDRILSFTAEYNCTTSFHKPLSDIRLVWILLTPLVSSNSS